MRSPMLNRYTAILHLLNKQVVWSIPTYELIIILACNFGNKRVVQDISINKPEDVMKDLMFSQINYLELLTIPHELFQVCQ